MNRLTVVGALFNILSFKGTLQSEAEHRLINRLLQCSSYNKNVLPSAKPGEPVNVVIDKINLIKLTNINETTGTVDMAMWMEFKWNDTDLSWSPPKYDDLKHVAVRATEVWTPDMMILSGWGVPEVSLREFKEHDVILRSSGEVFYYPPANLTMPCLNVTETNELECNFAVGSWTLLIDMLDLHLTNSQLDLSHIVIDPRYKIKSHSLEEKIIIIPAYPDEPWELIIVKIKLERI